MWYGILVRSNVTPFWKAGLQYSQGFGASQWRQQERRGTDYTYHADAQGSTRGITAGGAVTDAVLYDAFGNTISRSGSTPTPVLYNGAAGYQSDSATGLQLLGHRYYDPSIGRFLSSDPAQAGTNCYGLLVRGNVTPLWELVLP